MERGPWCRGQWEVTNVFLCVPALGPAFAWAEPSKLRQEQHETEPPLTVLRKTTRTSPRRRGGSKNWKIALLYFCWFVFHFWLRLFFLVVALFYCCYILINKMLPLHKQNVGLTWLCILVGKGWRVSGSVCPSKKEGLNGREEYVSSGVEVESHGDASVLWHDAALHWALCVQKQQTRSHHKLQLRWFSPQEG